MEGHKQPCLLEGVAKEISTVQRERLTILKKCMIKSQAKLQVNENNNVASASQVQVKKLNGDAKMLCSFLQNCAY